MWTDWLTRFMPASGPLKADANRAFQEAVAEARSREANLRPLYEQLTFAQRVAEDAVPIDRATIPLNLTLGPDKVKELAAQLKLSPYLKENLQVLVRQHQSDLQALKRAEQAATHLATRPGLTIAESALSEVRALFTALPASREQFREYPAFYRLLAEAAGVSPDGTGMLPPPPAPPPPAEVPDDLVDFFDGQAARSEGGPLTLDEDYDEFKDPQSVVLMLNPPPMTLELGLDLVPLVDPALGGTLLKRMVPMRVCIAMELGFVTPGIQLKDNLNLAPTAYRVLVRGLPVARGEIMPGHWLAVETPDADITKDLNGFPVIEPAFGKHAHWVANQEAKRAAQLGYLVLDATAAIIGHLDEVIRVHAHEMLSLDEVNLMLDHTAQKLPQTVSSVFPDRLDLAEYHQMLKGLLRERVSIRDQVTIMETVAHAIKPPGRDALPPTPMAINVMVEPQQLNQLEPLMNALPRMQRPDADMLLEKVRKGLSRQICASLANNEDVVEVIMLEQRLEQQLMDTLLAGDGRDLDLPHRLLNALSRRIVEAAATTHTPTVFLHDRLRGPFKRATMRTLPSLNVLGYGEVHPHYNVQDIHRISLDEY